MKVFCVSLCIVTLIHFQHEHLTRLSIPLPKIFLKVFFLFFLHLAEHLTDKSKTAESVYFSHGPYLNFTCHSYCGVMWDRPYLFEIMFGFTQDGLLIRKGR